MPSGSSYPLPVNGVEVRPGPVPGRCRTARGARGGRVADADPPNPKGRGASPENAGFPPEVGPGPTMAQRARCPHSRPCTTCLVGPGRRLASPTGAPERAALRAPRRGRGTGRSCWTNAWPKFRRAACRPRSATTGAIAQADVPNHTRGRPPTPAPRRIYPYRLAWCASVPGNESLHQHPVNRNRPLRLRPALEPTQRRRSRQRLLPPARRLHHLMVAKRIVIVQVFGAQPRHSLVQHRQHRVTNLPAAERPRHLHGQAQPAVRLPEQQRTPFSVTIPFPLGSFSVWVDG